LLHTFSRTLALSNCLLLVLSVICLRLSCLKFGAHFYLIIPDPVTSSRGIDFKPPVVHVAWTSFRAIAYLEGVVYTFE